MTETVPCIHEDFVFDVVATRILDNDGVLIRYSADIYVDCATCGVPFEWVGLPMGYSPDSPTTSLSRHELRAPMDPCTERILHPIFHEEA